MKKEELLRRVGSMQQAAGIRAVRCMEGKAGGMKAFEVKNDRMSFMVLEDKCLDIGELSYKGCNMNFLSKPGLTGRAHYDTNGGEAIRSIMGGMLFTSGLRNICTPCTVQGEDFPMHGRIRTTPAEHVCSDAWWEDGVYRLRIAGEMREAALFGENLVLRREITTAYQEKSIHIRDVVINQGFREEPFLILYHFNIGWPLLSEECDLIIPSSETLARGNLNTYFCMRWQLMRMEILLRLSTTGNWRWVFRSHFLKKPCLTLWNGNPGHQAIMRWGLNRQMQAYMGNNIIWRGGTTPVSDPRRKL